MLGKLQITLSLCYQILVCLIATGFSFNRSTVMYQEIDLDSFFPPQNVPAIFILNNCVLSSVTKIVLLNLGICVCLLCRLFLFHPYIYALLYSSKNCCLIVRVYMGVLTFSSFFFLSHCKDSISAPFQSNTLRSYTQRRNLYLEEQRKVGVHAFRNHIS